MSTPQPPPLDEPIVFGPVPSRRLGRSLGINNIPAKSCSYSCIYCQVGETIRTTAAPRRFHELERLITVVSERVRALREAGEAVDYLTFVPDGEPTLDVRLGEAIDRLRPLGVPIAVISNGSLTFLPEVRAALARADWVSLKLDAVDEQTWRSINRPDRALQIERILDGMRRFADEFHGELATETMLIEAVNDRTECLEAIAGVARTLKPAIAYLAIPTRPTAEAGAVPASEASITRAYALFSARLPAVELLTGYEGSSFSSTGDPAADLLSITAVHPMREDAVRELLRRNGAAWSVVDALIAAGSLVEVRHREHRFYVRRWRR